MKRFLVGSKYFFSCYPDFTPGDEDTVEIIDTEDFQWSRVFRGQGRCIFQFNSRLTKEEHIQKALWTEQGLTIGKFLVPEFAQEIGFGIEDLDKLYPLVSQLKTKHKYEQIIYESYKINNSFTLTEEQRAAAYKACKEARICQN